MIRLMIVSAAAVSAATAAPAFAQPAAPPAADYVAQAGASDMFEITEAKLAQHRSHDPQILAFARKMVTDHTKSTAMVKAAATRSMGSPPPPPVMNSQQQSDLATLKATSSADFNRTYLSQQVQSHQQALALQQAYAQGGGDPALQGAAAKITPVVQMHLDMATKLAASAG